MGHLAAAGGMTNVHGPLQIEMRRQSRKVVGIMIHVMTVARLCGPAVAPSVMGDDAITVFEEEQHLVIPVIGRQRPAVAEHDGLTLAPVLVKDLDIVLGRDDRHGTLFVAVGARGGDNGPWLLRAKLYQRGSANFIAVGARLLSRAPAKRSPH